MHRVTVFGGSGFIGRYIVERLADRDVVVTVAVRHPERAKFLMPLGNVGQVVPVAASLHNTPAIAAAVAGADAVLNLVGILSEGGRQTFKSVHADGAGRVARAAAEAGVQQFIQLSAIGASPTAGSEYARSKAAGEVAVREAFPQATVLRPSIVFGAEDGFFNMFGGLARLLPALPLYGGGTTRFQPVYVGDVADAAMAVLDDPACRGVTYSLGGPRVYTFAELLQLILAEVRRRRILVPLPYFVGALQAFFLEFLPNPPLTRDQLRQLRTDNIVGSADRTLADLGITPTALEVVLPTYMARYRRGGRLGRVSVV